MSRAVLVPVCFLLGLVVAWQALVVAGDIPEYLLPSPLVILRTLDRSLLIEIGYTAGEALCGFMIASTLAFAGAALFVRFRTIEQGLFPFAITLKTTPIVAIAPPP
jgi:NitT/TauT family transport system permease protein